MCKPDSIKINEKRGIRLANFFKFVNKFIIFLVMKYVTALSRNHCNLIADKSRGQHQVCGGLKNV